MRECIVLWIKENSRKATFFAVTHWNWKNAREPWCAKKTETKNLRAQSRNFLSFYYFQQTSPKCFHNDFVAISISDSITASATVKHSSFHPPLHHSQPLSRWRTQWTRRRKRRRRRGRRGGWFYCRYAQNGPLYKVNSLVVLIPVYSCKFPKSISRLRQCLCIFGSVELSRKVISRQLLHYPTHECQHARLTLSRANINSKYSNKLFTILIELEVFDINNIFSKL